jgi:hypothetical protein
MPTRLVIPEGATPSDIGHKGRTWQQIAADAKVDGIANLGDAWTLEYGINGLGIASPTETLAERAAREAAELAAGANRRTVEDRVRAYITASKTFLAIPSPTNAQVAAQVRRNTQAIIGLAKLALNDLTDLDGTNGP